MCYFVNPVQKLSTIEKQYRKKFKDKKGAIAPDETHRAKISGFSYPELPLILPDTADFGVWGLIPDFAKAVDAFRKETNTLNARIETLAEKAVFKSSLNNRCVLPIQSFFEYQWLDTKGKQKRLFEISATNDNLLSLACIFNIYENWGKRFLSFSIITTQANELMAEIHNSKKRMPVVLEAEEVDLWLQREPISLFENRNKVKLTAVAEPIEPDAQLSLF
ncbi:SOS response-associated peptidase [Flavobacterium sp.]|uniref:SOS response-associated peptidase n=1 Tax=Flavobacterium sp. TaxID=239 RepID=UPI003B9CDB77